MGPARWTPTFTEQEPAYQAELPNPFGTGRGCSRTTGVAKVCDGRLLRWVLSWGFITSPR